MKVVVATGGTGGHIFPALQTAHVLKERGHQIIFLGSLGAGEENINKEGFETIVLKAQGLTNKSFVGLIKFGSLMVQAISQSLKELRRIKPDKVIGFGGYGSFAVVLSARILNIPTMIHEQNVVPGKANCLLAKLVKKIAISFPETRNHLNSNKTIWTGCPSHQKRPLDTREALLKKFSLDPHLKTILVLGGSQGSQRLNEVFFEVVSSWHKEQGVQAIHMTGKKDYALYAGKYQKSVLPVKVFEFINPIEEAYAVSDVVIARSGAATVSELGYFAIPTIFIPYPLADGHQKYNALVLSNLGLAQIIEQKDLTKGSLNKALEGILSADFDQDSWKKKTKNNFKESPAYELARAVENL